MLLQMAPPWAEPPAPPLPPLPPSPPWNVASGLAPSDEPSLPRAPLPPCPPRPEPATFDVKVEVVIVVELLATMVGFVRDRAPPSPFPPFPPSPPLPPSLPEPAAGSPSPPSPPPPPQTVFPSNCVVATLIVPDDAELIAPPSASPPWPPWPPSASSWTPLPLKPRPPLLAQAELCMKLAPEIVRLPAARSMAPPSDVPPFPQVPPGPVALAAWLPLSRRIGLLRALSFVKIEFVTLAPLPAR
jgi:hypothetical protein